jgi:hypothetical protein
VTRRALLLALALLAAAAAPAAGAAPPKVPGGLHDARYCEILELHVVPPAATVTVWNTIGLGTCPAAKWKALDAAALAKELGAAFVILNGPRHFLMDSATARTGTVRSFHGMKMTRVASIRIRSVTELAQAPFMDRTIKRRNTWRFKRGRRVFELVVPGGDTYVMQSYAQIEDPALALRDLPKLGRRLALPDGWRYRSRRLAQDLVLRANGSATVLQDDLQNTYQLATTTRRPGKRVRRAVDMRGTTRTVGSSGPGMVEDRGTLAGTPFGRGSLVLLGAFREGILDGTFRLRFADGSIVGTASLPYTVSGSELDFAGTGRFTGGTGAYRGITASGLDVRDHNTLDGQNGTIAVTGSAAY